MLPQHFSFTQTFTRVSITWHKHGTCFLFPKSAYESWPSRTQSKFVTLCEWDLDLVYKSVISIFCVYIIPWVVCSGSVSLSVSLKVHLLSHITCREQVPLLSWCVMSAVMTMKWFLCVENLCKEHDYQQSDRHFLWFCFRRAEGGHDTGHVHFK